VDVHLHTLAPPTWAAAAPVEGRVSVGEFLAEGIKKRRLEMTRFFFLFLFLIVDMVSGRWVNLRRNYPQSKK